MDDRLSDAALDELFGKVYAHCVIKYDPAAGKRVLRQALSADPRPGAGDASGVEIDEIMSRIYRRFKDWSKRKFTADDVTWCEVKADVLAILSALSASPAATRGEPFGYVVDGQFFQSDPGALNGKVAVYTQPATPPVLSPESIDAFLEANPLDNGQSVADAANAIVEGVEKIGDAKEADNG